MTTPNPVKSQRFEVTSDDEENPVTEVYHLEFGWAALAEIEEHYDGRLDDNGKQIEIGDVLKKPKFRDLIFLFQCGLRKNHPDLTDDVVTDIMDDLGKGAGMELLGQAFAKAFVDAKKTKRGAGEATADPTSPPAANRTARRKATAASRKGT